MVKTQRGWSIQGTLSSAIECHSQSEWRLGPAPRTLTLSLVADPRPWRVTASLLAFARAPGVSLGVSVYLGVLGARLQLGPVGVGSCPGVVRSAGT